MDALDITFDISQNDEIVKCFDECGVVIVKNVLTKQECKNTFIDMNIPDNCNIMDPTTYENFDLTLNKYGMINAGVQFTRALLYNRTHKNVRKVFELLFKDTKLLVQHDRYGIMRPTSGQYGKKEWKTPTNNNIHLDVDPFGYFKENFRQKIDEYFEGIKYDKTEDFVSENNAKHYTMNTHIQSVLNLVDNRFEDGGFCCIPLENRYETMKNWTRSHSKYKLMEDNAEPNGKYIFTNSLDDKNIMSRELVRMYCPAGSLICFDAILPHGTLSNFSDRIRVAQFIRYIPENIIKNHKERAKLVQSECDKVGFEINDENREILIGDYK